MKKTWGLIGNILPLSNFWILAGLIDFRSLFYISGDDAGSQWNQAGISATGDQDEQRHEAAPLTSYHRREGNRGSLPHVHRDTEVLPKQIRMRPRSDETKLAAFDAVNQ